MDKWKYFGIGAVIVVFAVILLKRRTLTKHPMYLSAKARMKEIFSKQGW